MMSMIRKELSHDDLMLLRKLVLQEADRATDPDEKNKLRILADKVLYD